MPLHGSPDSLETSLVSTSSRASSKSHEISRRSKTSMSWRKSFRPDFSWTPLNDSLLSNHRSGSTSVLMATCQRESRGLPSISNHGARATVKRLRSASTSSRRAASASRSKSDVFYGLLRLETWIQESSHTKSYFLQLKTFILKTYDQWSEAGGRSTSYRSVLPKC